MERSRAILNHGGKAPIPPSLCYSGIVREESACGRQRMRKYAPSDRLTGNVVYGTNRLHRSPNRVRVPSGRVRRAGNAGSICPLTNRPPAPRAKPIDSTAPNRVRYALRRREHELLDQQTSASRTENTKQESMCLMKDRLTALCATLTDSTTPHSGVRRSRTYS